MLIYEHVVDSWYVLKQFFLPYFPMWLFLHNLPGVKSRLAMGNQCTTPASTGTLPSPWSPAFLSMVWYQYFVHMVPSHLCSRTIRPDNNCSFCRAWPTSFPQVKLPTINLATFTILFQGLKQSTCYGHCNHRWHWQVSYHLLDYFKQFLNALLNF